MGPYRKSRVERSSATPQSCPFGRRFTTTASKTVRPGYERGVIVAILTLALGALVGPAEGVQPLQLTISPAPVECDATALGTADRLFPFGGFLFLEGNPIRDDRQSSGDSLNCEITAL